jgi:hypothetical protein
MSTGMPRDFEIVLAANTPRELGAIGKFIGVIDAPSGPIDIAIDSFTALRRGPGGSVILSQPFKRCTLTSTVAQTVRVLVADEIQDVSNITSSGGGGAPLVIEAPSEIVASPDDVAVADGATNTTLIPANTARRRITVGVLSSSAGPIRVQAAGANNASGVEIAPGMSYRFDTTAALELHAPTGGGGATVYVFEES